MRFFRPTRRARPDRLQQFHSSPLSRGVPHALYHSGASFPTSPRRPWFPRADRQGRPMGMFHIHCWAPKHAPEWCTSPRCPCRPPLGWAQHSHRWPGTHRAMDSRLPRQGRVARGNVLNLLHREAVRLVQPLLAPVSFPPRLHPTRGWPSDPLVWVACSSRQRHRHRPPTSVQADEQSRQGRPPQRPHPPLRYCTSLSMHSVPPTTVRKALLGRHTVGGRLPIQPAADIPAASSTPIAGPQQSKRATATVFLQ